jgi:chromosomal replication initiator protein
MKLYEKEDIVPENLDYKTLWETAMAQIKAKIETQDFDRWFKIDYADSQEGEIFVSAPSLFHRDNIIHRYGNLIDATVEKITGKKIKINILARNAIPEAQADVKHTPAEKPAKIDVHISQKLPKKRTPPQLNKEFVFENYVVGDTNQFAVNAALAVSKNPGTAYNPLFIYSGVGLGKTHLMHAIGNYVYQNSENKIVYTTAESFLNDYTESIKENSMRDFRAKYRQSNLLLIDDIHFLENKSGLQEELFNTFNALINTKNHMVFTCDRPVSELKHFSERLTSRLGSGLSVDLQIPQYEMRCAILQKKIEERGLSISPDIIDLICKNISSNVRDIVSALNKLIGYAELIKKPISFAVAQEQLQDMFSSPKQLNVSMDNIQHVIANYFSLSINDLRSKKRTKNIVYPRQLAMYVIKAITEFSLTDIGQSFGGRDHTTVLHSLKIIEDRVKSDPAEERLIQNLIKSVKEYSVK